MPAATSISVDRITPILRCDDAMNAAAWYSKLGFEIAAVHEFEPDSPRFVTLRANGLWLFLSEHEGDASPDTLIYLHIEDVDEVARRFGVAAHDKDHGMREVHLTDPAGNRVRVGWGIPEA